MSDAQREVDLRRAISHNQYTKLELTWHGIALHLLHEDFQGETLERLLKRDFRGEASEERLCKDDSVAAKTNTNDPPIAVPGHSRVVQ
jgi:hypothetical protein